MSSHNHIKSLCWIVLYAFIPFNAYANDNVLKLGIFPYANPGYLAKLHLPIKNHFQAATPEHIQMLSAANFKTFKNNTKNGLYDIIITAPHLGRLAEKKANYQWLGFTSNSSHAVFAVNRQNDSKTLADFKGQTITLPPKTAIIHHLALNKLKEAGLRPGIDITIKETKSHNNAMLAVIQNITPISAFGKPTWSKFKPQGRENVIKLTQSENIPGFAIMAHPRLGTKTISELKQRFFSFQETESGKMYFEQTGLKGARKETAQDLQKIDKYLNELQQVKKTK
ncbi:MAG: PhnD/SsuA/transferrin family substrate-binding protein [Pseudomonadota bacterium]|nr:PhnD/SsuA/transferrin family substrate-binding protein [Pseudomonadota bacterium]